jgi:spore germination protein GerM
VSRRRLLAAATLAVLVVSGCGIQNDDEPRGIDDSNRPDFVANTSNAPISSSGSDRIYLLAPSNPTESHRLRAAARDVGDSARQRLQSLFGPLSVTESIDRLTTAIPDGMQLNSAVLRSDGTLVVDVTDELLALSINALIDAVAQIVFTASEVSEVQQVELLVNGRARQWPASDGELQVQPLTVYDYPGFVESTQPDFPQVPSPAPGTNS